MFTFIIKMAARARKKMTFVENDQINFNHMEKELQKIIDEDGRYWEENEAKFRAVNQGVATYEEFRDIVKAAHLKPLDKKNFLRPKKIWNVFSNKNGKNPSNRTATPYSTQQNKNVSFPTNYHEFTQQWRKEYLTDVQRFEFLKNIGSERLRLVLREELTFGILGEILHALLKHSNSIEDIVLTARLLEILTSTKRFGLALQFLNSSERAECQLLFSELQKDLYNNQQDLAEKGITEWTISELSKKFNVEEKHYES